MYQTWIVAKSISRDNFYKILDKKIKVMRTRMQVWTDIYNRLCEKTLQIWEMKYCSSYHIKTKGCKKILWSILSQKVSHPGIYKFSDT